MRIMRKIHMHGIDVMKKEKQRCIVSYLEKMTHRWRKNKKMQSIRWCKVMWYARFF